MEELQGLIKRMKDTFNGEPWFGKSVMKILNEVDPSTVYTKPNHHSHSLIELLYHMLTWEEFARQQLEDINNIDPQETQRLDWRQTNPDIHTWHTGIAELSKSHHTIIHILESSSEDVLNRSVKFRDYDMRHLINGLIEHNIYHIGQVAYLHKYLHS